MLASPVNTLRMTIANDANLIENSIASSINRARLGQRSASATQVYNVAGRAVRDYVVNRYDYARETRK